MQIFLLLKEHSYNVVLVPLLNYVHISCTTVEAGQQRGFLSLLLEITTCKAFFYQQVGVMCFNSTVHSP